jgi:hypothetical protein
MNTSALKRARRERTQQPMSYLFQPRVSKFPGAQHTLDQVLEGIDLCIAQTAAQQPQVIAFLKNC